MDLGTLYKNGFGVEEDAIEAVRLFREAADDGFPVGMVQRGLCYRDGVGLDADDKEALSLFKRAAELGDGNGLIHLGACYRTGPGVEENHKEASRLFRRASNEDEWGREFRLAHSYFSKRKWVEDHETFRMSKTMAHSGSLYAQVNMGFICLNEDSVLDSETEDPIEATRYFRMASDQGSN